MAKSLSYSYNQYICKTPLNIYLEYQLKDPTEIGHGTELQSEEKILHLWQNLQNTRPEEAVWENRNDQI